MSFLDKLTDLIWKEVEKDNPYATTEAKKQIAEFRAERLAEKIYRAFTSPKGK